MRCLFKRLVRTAAAASPTPPGSAPSARIRAEWFGEGEPILRAEHLDRAGDPAAARAYLTAAEDQMTNQRLESALRLAERGIELDAPDAVKCALLLLRGELLREIGHSEESLAAFRAGLALAGDDAQRCRAWMGIAAGHRVTGDIPVAMEALDHAAIFAERLGLEAERSRIHHTRGNLYFAIGDVDACRAQHEAALASAPRALDTECEAQGWFSPSSSRRSRLG